MEKIEQQKEQIISGGPKIEILKSCNVGDGILRLKNKEFYLHLAEKSDMSESFFIPASGSGSRMFKFLYDFLNAPGSTESGKVEKFVNHIRDFAFFQKLPIELQQDVINYDFNIHDLVDFIVKDSGLNLGSKPKALIPFHKFGPFVLNPLQEHILQGVATRNKKTSFHFTINQDFQTNFEQSIASIQELAGNKIEYSLSVQDPETNSYVFDKELNPVLEDGIPFRRPSGHGALLANLNSIHSDVIFVKNIDNVQHFNNAKPSQDAFKMIKGIIADVKSRFLELMDCDDNSFEKEFDSLNGDYELFPKDWKKHLSIEEVKKMVDRPIRVCGMVKNEGEPGGGPFWIQESDGKVSKQIVEKSQIDLNSGQFKVLTQSTHFNPVFMGLSTKNLKGEKFDLMNFRNEKEFFVVQKSQKGKDVQFVEQPGLWNGGMYNWNTIFIELDASVFTPVKTILDLLKPLHF